jgi:glycerol-3-phosphate dehydrogenase
VLDLDAEDGRAPMLNIFGGKITTYRKLAEHAMEKLAPLLSPQSRAWTSGAILPGGDMPEADFERFAATLIAQRPGLPAALLRRFARAYGTRVATLLGDARDVAGLGHHFGGDLYAAEVDYLARHEWARTGHDVLFRRSKLGLKLDKSVESALDEHLAAWS